MGTCPGFEDTLKATLRRRFVAATPIDAPTTVAFGSRDRLLLRHQSRHLDELPAHTHIGALPGCGHVPMTDDPAAVTGLIRRSAGRMVPPRLSWPGGPGQPTADPQGASG
jgi:pimeloyl-ACP methyl ester carboxylesterase